MKVPSVTQKTFLCLFALVVVTSMYSSFPTISFYLPQHLYNNDIGILSKERNGIHPSKLEHIRFAAFGTSDTYGSGIPSENERQEAAFPFLLSSSAKNYAIRASSPNYPKACAQSIIDKGPKNPHEISDPVIFDVIILEYFVRGYNGLIPLVERLRARYPDAIIILLREWNPLMNIFVEDESKEIDNMCSWAKRKGIDVLDKEQMNQAMQESNLKLTWKQIIDQDKISIQEEVARRFGAFILPMERPEDPMDWIQSVELFAPDWHHKSKEGHAEVAKRISRFLDNKEIATNPRIGEWSYQDQCFTWFESGDTKGVQYSGNVKLENFANKNGPKYALSFYDKVGTVTLTNPNPLDIPMTLYIAYMSSGPNKYPQTEIQIIHKENDQITHQNAIILDTHAPNDWNNVPVHVQKIVNLGDIMPGVTILSFKALNESQWPFRLVSVALTQKNDVPHDNNDGKVRLIDIPGHELNLNVFV